MQHKKIAILFGIMVLVAPAALAVVTFEQLNDDIFVVSHRVKLIGSRVQAMRAVYEKAGSVCVAAGYTHLEILDQESQAWQSEESANASIRVRFFVGDGGERMDCERMASPRYVEQARLKLEKNGYRNAAGPMSAAADPNGAPRAGIGSCTEEQVATMEAVGLLPAQIEAACRR